MSDCGVTNFSGTFSISTTVAGTDLDESGFGALTYTAIPNMGNHGDSGVSQNIVNYSTWDRNVICKGKGEADAGSPTVEFLDVDGAGLDLLIAAADVDNANAYAFKLTWPDNSVEYNRGVVTGPMRLHGGNEDFKRVQFNLGFNQQPVIVAATA